jgi:hypothetical protein
MAATEVSALVIEAIQKMVSSCIGASPKSPSRPNAPR